MSHAATKWAFDQPENHRDMKPGEFVVLMVLADCHNPIHGCFPSQDYICSRTNLSERAVRDLLGKLKDRGLVNWDEARENGRRGSNRYALAFEGGCLPAKSAGRSTGKKAQEQPAESDTNNRQNLPPNLVKEPVKEPLREGASESEGENRKQVEASFWELVKNWPGFAGMPKEPAKKAWFALSADERAEAIVGFPAWQALLKAQRKTHTPAPSTYFAERLWKDIPEAPPEPDKPLDAPAFGPLWNAMRLRCLLTETPLAGPRASAWIEATMAQNDAAGRRARMERQAAHGWPKVKAMHERAMSRRGTSVHNRFEPLAALMEPVKRGGELWQSWRAEHEKRGWPWVPDPGGLPVVWFPKGGPDGLDAFEAAVRGLEQ